jgi:hypothetical protein
MFMCRAFCIPLDLCRLAHCSIFSAQRCGCLLFSVPADACLPASCCTSQSEPALRCLSPQSVVCLIVQRAVRDNRTTQHDVHSVYILFSGFYFGDLHVSGRIWELRLHSSVVHLSCVIIISFSDFSDLDFILKIGHTHNIMMCLCVCVCVCGQPGYQDPRRIFACGGDVGSAPSPSSLIHLERIVQQR